MKYALVNGERQEAKKGLSARCQCCDSLVVAKCGDIRVHHWAHSEERQCDPWKESETEWHRAWKDHFPKEWQEIVCPVGNGQNHRADVKIPQGHVIEFQHSLIKQEERKAREEFYGKMIWIVDGTKRLKDKDKFMEIMWSEPIGSKMGLAGIRDHFGQSALLRDWGDSGVPVFFDFGEKLLWCCWPKICLKDKFIRITQLLELERIDLSKKFDLSTFLQKKALGGWYAFKIERNVLIRILQEDRFEAVYQNWSKRIAGYDNHLNIQSVLREVQSQNANNANYRPQQGRSVRL